MSTPFHLLFSKKPEVVANAGFKPFEKGHGAKAEKKCSCKEGESCDKCKDGGKKAWVPPWKKKVENAGTSEGAKLGWERRRGMGEESHKGAATNGMIAADVTGGTHLRSAATTLTAGDKKFQSITHFIEHPEPDKAVVAMQEHLGSEAAGNVASLGQAQPQGRSGWKVRAETGDGDVHHFRFQKPVKSVSNSDDIDAVALNVEEDKTIVANAGTSEGAKRGWETRKGGASSVDEAWDKRKTANPNVHFKKLTPEDQMEYMVRFRKERNDAGEDDVDIKSLRNFQTILKSGDKKQIGHALSQMDTAVYDDVPAVIRDMFIKAPKTNNRKFVPFKNRMEPFKSSAAVSNTSSSRVKLASNLVLSNAAAYGCDCEECKDGKPCPDKAPSFGKATQRKKFKIPFQK